MANKNLFGASKPVSASSSNRTHVSTPATETTNNAGGKAYESTAKHALAQITATNCFNGTFYADANENLQLAKDAVQKLHGDPEFIAKVAIFARDKAYMKDMPAYLTAVLATLGNPKLFRKVFDRVIDNGKMLRNFIQIGRSGQAGKVLNMSSGAIRNAIDNWFATRSSYTVFRASVGNEPSMRDMLRMSRPKPNNEEKAALFAYLKGAEFDAKAGEYLTRHKDGSVMYRHSFDSLPSIVRQYEQFKKSHEGEIPNVDFRMLDSILTKDEARRMWASQAQKCGWTMTRMNLNNFAKYGVFEDKSLVQTVVDRLKNREEIVKARVYPYQLMMAYSITEGSNVPHEVREALQDAMEIALENVPEVNGKVYICVDTSGSMSSAITGTRVGSTSKVRCVDVASLFAAALLRKNKSAEILPFDTSVHRASFNPRDSVMTTAMKLASYGGGGTDCSCALRELNNRKAQGAAVIFVSDNESWVDSANSYYNRGTGLLNEWNHFKGRNPTSKLVCIDLTPRSNSQVKEDKDILQIGGFGDQVFDVVANFIEHGSSNDHWVDLIESIDLDKEDVRPEEPIVTEM